MAKQTQTYRGIRIMVIGAAHSFVAQFSHAGRVHTLKVTNVMVVTERHFESALGVARKKIDELLGPDTALPEPARVKHIPA